MDLVSPLLSMTLFGSAARNFPLSVTVERPRFAWSADCKTRARRIYRPGERFKT